MIYEGIKCYNCEGTDFEKIYYGRDRLQNRMETFEIIMCNKCKIFYTYPQLTSEQIKSFYQKDYFGFTPSIKDETNILKKFDRQRMMTQRRKYVMKEIHDVGKILDIGCSTGNFLSEMNKYGWECYGIEPDEFAANYAMQNYDFFLFNGYLKDTHFSDNFFDVITLWDVLEHTKEPRFMLLEIYRILKPNGILFLSLPNSNSYERMLFGPYWAGWEVPRHYVTFNDRNIMEFLKKVNFSDIKIKSFFGRHGVFVISIKFWLNDLPIPELLKIILIKLSNSLLFRIILFPFFKYFESIDKSSIMSISAKKSEITP